MPAEGAIMCYFTQSGFFPHCLPAQIEIGDTLTGKKNYFQDCNQAIYTKRLVPKIINNKFKSILGSAIYSIDVGHNTQIIQDTIANPGIGIRVQNTNPSQIGQAITIKNNYVENLSNDGIWLTNLYSYNGINPYIQRQVRVKGNAIKCTKNYSNPYYGIRVENCKKIEVRNNTVYHTLHIFEGSRGIYIANSSDGIVINNNYIKNMDHGIEGSGVLTNTKIWCNYMETCKNGIYFNPISTIASNQGNDSLPSDNLWAISCNNRISGLLIGTPINWYFRQDTTVLNYYAIHITDPTLTLKIIAEPNTNYTGPCAIYKSDTGYMDAGIREQKYGAIVRGEMTFDDYSDEFGYLTDQYLFAELNYHPDYIELNAQDDSDYIDFYSSYSNSNMMSILQVQNNIDTGNLQTAGMLNNGITAENNIEQIRLLTNDVYLRALMDSTENGYTQDDIGELLKISGMSPDYFGDGIYSACVLLGIEPNSTGNNKMKTINNSNDTITKINEGIFSVYPNPAAESIVIDYNGDVTFLQKCQIEFYDIYGKQVKSVFLNKTSETVNINDLSPGMYIYVIKNINSILKKDKLIKM